MVVILEGMKRSGKTTYATKLKELSSLPVYYLNDRTLLESVETDSVKDVVYGSCHTMVQMAKIIEKTTNGNCLIIFDRLHLSELVYGYHSRWYEADGMWKIDKELRSLFPYCLLFTSDTADERTGINSYKDDFILYSKQSCLNWKPISLDETNGKVTHKQINMVLQDYDIKYSFE